ncbi:hypothetical protein MXB_2243, partial [Myxobolus squamalis]
SLKTVKYLCCWQLLQLVLYFIVPGKIASGRVMSSGRILRYQCNGFYCLLISNLLVIILSCFGFIDPVYFVNNILEFLVLSNLLGLFLTMIVYLKAVYHPNFEQDCYFSGSPLYDVYCGVEHSPRILFFDFKQFFNARVGIALWPLINLSYAIKMYQLHHTITYSMMLVNVLQFLYVLDLFLNEDWYMRTIDIAYDHFGFYLAWGDIVWLPFMYTLQGYYLVQHPTNLSAFYSIFILLLGIFSIIFFRKSNSQKESFRKVMTEGKIYKISDKPVNYIEAGYFSDDSKFHKSYLLADGFWGISRHFNYLDNLRCKEKYGKKWDEYCQLVPYKLIPYVY